MQSGIWKTLSGILSLGNIAFVPGKGNYAKIHHKEELTIASTLLEISPEELEKGLLFKVSVIKGEKISSPLTVEQVNNNKNFDLFLKAKFFVPNQIRQKKIEMLFVRNYINLYLIG